MRYWSGIRRISLRLSVVCGLLAKKFWTPTWPGSPLFAGHISSLREPTRLSRRCRGLTLHTIRYRKFSHACCWWAGKARRRREYDRRVPDSRVEDTDREKEPPAQKGFNPMTGRKM